MVLTHKLADIIELCNGKENVQADKLSTCIRLKLPLFESVNFSHISTQIGYFLLQTRFFTKPGGRKYTYKKNNEESKKKMVRLKIRQ